MMRVDLKVTTGYRVTARRFWLTSAWLAVASVCAVVACESPVQPSTTTPSPFVVSSPVPDLSVVSSAAGTQSLAAAVVYVSLPPGAIPNGVSATIRNIRTGASVTVAVVDGGFDPVALPGVAGDTLAVAVQAVAGAAATSYVSTVPAAVRPIVIRTSPPPHKRDVPLNAIMVIVFSEPLAPSTVNSGSVQLFRGTVQVAGTVRFGDAEHLRVEFHPDNLLAPRTDYQLVVTTAITDVNGQTLDSAVAFQFTTGTSEPATELVFASVSTGAFHTCGLTTGGSVYCWGSNEEGGFGDGTTASSATPVAAAGGLSFAAVGSGYLYTCGMTSVGSVYCWGRNYERELGIDSGPQICNGSACSTTPIAVAGGLTFAAVSVGQTYFCGVTTAGDVDCWGGGFYGAPTVVDGLTFSVVSAGEFGGASCGVTTTGAAYCWGDNQWGELGTGFLTGPEQCGHAPSSFPCSRTPVAVAGGLRFRQVDISGRFACGLTTSGSAYCWGAGWGAAPVAVAGGLTFAALSVGSTHACGLTLSGAAYCWGDNRSGELGDGTGTSSATPVAVAGGLTFAVLSAKDSGGGENTCGVTTTGVAYCWGQNLYGQLGDGTTTSSTVPVKVAGQP